MSRLIPEVQFFWESREMHQEAPTEERKLLGRTVLSHTFQITGPQISQEQEVKEDSLELKALRIQLTSIPVCSGDSKTGTTVRTPGVREAPVPYLGYLFPSSTQSGQSHLEEALDFFNPTQY